MGDSASRLVADILSGTLRLLDIPADTHAAAEATATMDVIDSPIALRRFEQAMRELLSHLEKANKAIRRLHVMAALPLSAAVVFGRFGNPDVHPAPLMHERVDGTNRTSLEVTR
jgi:hypothetical protein